MLRERIEDAFDWVVRLCGLTPPPRAPRALRKAVRALSSPDAASRRVAELSLCADWPRAAPLLRKIVSAQSPPAGAVRAAVLLHRKHEADGVEMLRRMVREPALRTGEASALLRQAVREIIGPGYYVRQATAALARLEQFPESFASVVRFRQALEILRFLDAPLPPDLLRRALVVRTIGGENLSLVRTVLEDTHSVAVEHVCLARKDAAQMTLHLEDRSRACALLLQTLEHPNPAVKLTAMHGLRRLGDVRAIAPLLQIAGDTASPVSVDAREHVEALNRGTPDVLTLLRPSAVEAALPAELVRPAAHRPEDAPDALLHSVTASDVHSEGK